MSFLDIHWISSVLEKCVGSHVIVPNKGGGPFPVMYLLHGLSDDYTMWHRRTRIEWYAEKYPMIVVMPDGYRGWYTNNEQGPAYARYLGEELPAFIERTFHARASGKARCIGGLSMGGYGALRLALGYAGRYVSAVSHSGAPMWGPNNFRATTTAEELRIFGEKPAGTDHDLLALAKKAKAAGKLPRIAIDCGTEDWHLEANRRFHKALHGAKIPHQYAEFPGNHNWDYWDIHVQEALAFHAKALGL